MKPLLMRHSEPINESFKIWQNAAPYKHNPWHFHPECEITYIQKGNGVLFVGDQMIHYKDNDLVILGSNLPHEWRSDILESPDLYSKSISLHFNRHLFGSPFYKLPEVAVVDTLLEQSVCGIKIDDPLVKKELKKDFNQLLGAVGMAKIYLLLKILHCISQTQQLTYLSSNSFLNTAGRAHDYRINKIYSYVVKNFTQALTIAQAASVINMTETSFCRFFKERTHRSFTRYLHEVRVGYACRLLLEGNYSISQVAYQCGFGNISNFNKQFKKIKLTTPTLFINEYTGK